MNNKHQYIRAINSFVSKYYFYLVLFLLSIVSFSSAFHYIPHGQNLLYGDALSRLNISRKVFDNLTPGLAQLGNIWLPLPQVLMLPFIRVKFLWQSGIAGAIMSMSAFFIAGIYIFKTIQVITKNLYAAFFGLAIFALNVNVLYLQTTAMSELVFLATLAVSIYYFSIWIQTDKKMFLIPAALAVSAMTLTRYEGLSILFISIPLVFLVAMLINKSTGKAEGQMFLYSILAITGFLGWTLYLTVIFGDPLYWLHYYASPQVITTTDFKTVVRHVSFLNAVWIYTTAIVWMTGLIPVCISVAGFFFILLKTVKNRTLIYVPLFLASAIFLFMIFTLQRNTPIQQPTLDIASIISRSTSYFPEFNIRYGLILLPLIAILTAVVFAIRSSFLRMVLVLLFVIQVISYVYPAYSVIYQLPLSISKNSTQGTPKEKALVQWLKSHYDHGLIMISALKHDPQMLQLGFDYKTYIHEGTGMYWKGSIKYPERYATWVVFDADNPDDQVTKYLKNSKYLGKFYTLMYDKDGMKVYRIKTKPELVN